MRCRGKPPSEWAVSWPRRSKSSTKKHKKQRGVPSQPARYSLEFFPYGSCLGQTKSPKIQFAKKVMESKRKPSDSRRNPRAGGRSAGIRTRGLLDPKIRLKSQGGRSAPFCSVCSSRKCFPDIPTPMPPSVPHTVWVMIWITRRKFSSFPGTAAKFSLQTPRHSHALFAFRIRRAASRISALRQNS